MVHDAGQWRMRQALVGYDVKHDVIDVGCAMLTLMAAKPRRDHQSHAMAGH